MEKIKQIFKNDQGKDIMIIIIVILMCLSSFGLGRLSKSTQNNEIKVIYPDQTANVLYANQENISSKNNINAYNTSLKSNNIAPNSTGKSFFASNRGHKYYPLGCSAGKTIKQENRVYFSTSLEAEKAGYELSSSC
jgi:hypothetical protein